MTESDVLDAICRNIAGRPLAVLSWRQLLAVREAVDRAFAREIDHKQADEPIRSGAS
jgi:hypothetical protein